MIQRSKLKNRLPPLLRNKQDDTNGVYMRKWLTIALFLTVSTLRAQTVNEQLWFEYMLNYPFANSFNLENAFNYNTLLNTPRWREVSYAATLEYTVYQNLEVLGATTISRTNQTESYNTFEIRPTIGARYFFTPNKRIQTRLLLRLDQRNFKNLDTDEWTQVYRPRVRGEMIIPINRDSYFQDKLWYALTDVEWLFKTDEDVDERFANRFRWRIGGGYRLNYSFRFEFLYMLQQSKNGIDEDFESSDNIFRFRIKHYLRKSKPSTAAGTGN